MKPITPLALLSAAAVALALTGCSGGSGSEGSDGALKVVVTTTQLADFAEQVGGDDIDLTGLLQPGASAHHFDPSPADLAALGAADVLIVNGAGLDEFVDSAIDASGFSGAIVDASDGVDLDEAKAITAEAAAEGGGHDDHDHAEEEHVEEGHDHADEHDEHADEHDHDHAEEEHADEGHDHADDHGEEEHDHDHGDLNPHLWTSPRFAIGMVGEVEHGLVEADPGNAGAYEERAAAYTAQLEALDGWAVAQFERVPEADRVLVSGHDSMRYFLHDYDIAFAGSLLPSFEDNAEPSVAETDALIAAIKEHGVKAIFVESSLSPKFAETIAKETGATVVSSDKLYVDSLGADGTGAETYIDATVHNTRVILEAWGVQPDPLPAELE